MIVDTLKTLEIETRAERYSLNWILEKEISWVSIETLGDQVMHIWWRKDLVYLVDSQLIGQVQRWDWIGKITGALQEVLPLRLSNTVTCNVSTTLGNTKGLQIYVSKIVRRNHWQNGVRDFSFINYPESHKGRRRSAVLWQPHEENSEVGWYSNH